MYAVLEQFVIASVLSNQGRDTLITQKARIFDQLEHSLVDQVAANEGVM